MSTARVWCLDGTMCSNAQREQQILRQIASSQTQRQTCVGDLCVRDNSFRHVLLAPSSGDAFQHLLARQSNLPDSPPPAATYTTASAPRASHATTWLGPWSGRDLAHLGAHDRTTCATCSLRARPCGSCQPRPVPNRTGRACTSTDACSSWSPRRASQARLPSVERVMCAHLGQVRSRPNARTVERFDNDVVDSTTKWVSANVPTSASLLAAVPKEAWSSRWTYSDITLKKDIADVDKTDSDKFSKLKPKKYRWKNAPPEDANREYYGFIAQEVQPLYPNMVNKAKDGKLSMDYQQLVPLLVDRVNALQKQVQEKQLCVGDTCIGAKEMTVLKNMA